MGAEVEPAGVVEEGRVGVDGSGNSAAKNSNEGGERGGGVTEELEGDGVQGESVLAPGREQLLDAEGGVLNLGVRKRRRIDFAP